jgi:hypothetical protein
MFEDLKAKRGGMSGKEKARLSATVAACLVVGAAVFGLKSCHDMTPEKTPVATPGKTDTTSKPLDPKPLEGLRARTDAPLEFDQPGLEYVIEHVEKDDFRREPDAVASPADVLALDPKDAVGKVYEVLGTVRHLDREAFESARLGDVESLWSFSLVGPDGRGPVVVWPGRRNAADNGRPVDRFRPAPAVVEEGDVVRVRAVFLQRRTGTVGAVALDGPTPALVAREFRRTVMPPSPVADVEAGDFATVRDRFLEDQYSVDDDVTWHLLTWLRARGHDAVVADLKSGKIPVRSWDREMFSRWSREIVVDRDVTDDPRTVTNEARGHVFVTTGALVDFVKEEWEFLPRNKFGVDERWQVWIRSDHYRNVGLRLDSAFPRSAYPGILPPVHGEGRRQQVKLYGVFVKNYSYTPRGGPDIPTERLHEITTPYFVLLHVEPYNPYVPTPLLENPFFWTWVSLLVFGVVFFGVVTRMEKREVSGMQERQKAIRQRRRGHAAPGSGGPAPGAGDAGPGPEPGGAAPP